MCLSCPEQPGCHSSAQHHFSKFHFYLQESRAPQNSSQRLKLFTELQGSELPYSEDGSAQLLKNILKPHNYLIKGIKVGIIVCIRCTLLITTSSTDVNVLCNSMPVWVDSSHPLVQKMLTKGDTISNITLLILCISRYFHFLCSRGHH